MISLASCTIVIVTKYGNEMNGVLHIIFLINIDLLYSELFFISYITPRILGENIYV